ncbi:MAG: ribonuclease H family protein [Rhodococcus sp. (in: high G+C Gram-positive bacteria)]|uniref:ribonuclease H family protein n=1 Tax=Rhodococcus sp. TaxID=1831 RepID=UPI003BAF80B1
MLAAIHIRQTNTPTECVTYASVAWEKDGITDTVLFRQPGSTTASRYSAGLDAFAYLVDATSKSGASAFLHITDAGLRRELTLVAESFPAIRMIEGVRGRLIALVENASTSISDHVAALRSDYEKRELAHLDARPELVVATDASKCARRRGVGAACVSNEGRHRQKVYPQTRSILAGELLAIELAVTGYRDRKLHILTDSRDAIACLRMERSQLISECDGEVIAVVENIRRLLRGREVRISWVRAHAGHPLNEIADRLAVSARRNHEACVPEPARRLIADNIVASLSLEQSAA